MEARDNQIMFEVEGQIIHVSTGVPAEVQASLETNDHVRTGDWSVTELLDNPRCARLKRLFPEEKRGDPATLVSSFIGTASHKLLEERTRKNIKEGELTYPEMALSATSADGFKISGTADLVRVTRMPVEAGGRPFLTVRDYKHWKTFKWQDGMFDDVFWQTQFYYFMAARHLMSDGVRILEKDQFSGECQATIFFLDWNKMDLCRRGAKGYPPYPIITLWFQPLPLNVIAAKIRERKDLHKALLDVPEEQWPDASQEDVWQRMTAVKVYKIGGERAVANGVFDPKDCGGIERAKELGKLKAAEVGGEARECWTERKRCESYCSVAEKCTTYQQYKAKHPTKEE